MRVETTPLEGVLLVKPKFFGDARGFFLETYQADRYAEMGISERFVQDNQSRSRQGVLRGLHYQLHHPQGKLVMVARGEVFDVAVDIRKASPTFGQWYGTVLNDQNLHQLFIPAGFAHGFCVLSEYADFCYKCTQYYAPHAERTIIYNDPDIGVDWPIITPSLSAKDQSAPRLREVPEDDLF